MSRGVVALGRWWGAVAVAASVSACAALACFKDVPIEETTTSTTAPDTTMEELCAGFGEACTPGGGCCDPCGACTAGICKANDAACGTCAYCDEGQCVQVSQGSPCGPEFACGEYLFGVLSGSCYAGKGVIRGQCGATGQCLAANSSSCVTRGDKVFECGVCLREDHACKAGAAVAGVSLADVCVTQGKIPGCEDLCVGDATAQGVQRQSCAVVDSEVAVECVVDAQEPCAEGFACDPQGLICWEMCDTDEQCLEAYACDAGACVLP